MSSQVFPNITNYKIEREIARGGMAVVYQGRHATLDRPVAIKLLKPEMMGNQVAIDRFLREPKILARFSHPNIVTIYDSGFLEDSQNQLYLIMEYLPGGSLKSKMQQGRFPLQRVIIIIKAIAGALDLAHARGVIHRDIKPDNILFQENGAPILTDFGVAKDLDSNTQATTAGTLLGTYRYMSPEQFQGLELDGRSDLYSLGILMVEMLTGERPYDGNSVEVLITKRLTEPVPNLPEEFHEFQSIAERLLVKDREQRFASAGELVNALEELEIKLGFVEPELNLITTGITNEAPFTKTQVKPAPARSSRRLLFAGVAAALITGAGVFIGPAVWQTLQIREVHAAIDKQIITIEQQLANLKDRSSYPKRLASAENLLQELQQQSGKIQSQIETGEQQHRQALQTIEQEKTGLQKTLSERQAELEQQQARFTKARIGEENVVDELREQLAQLERQTQKASAEHQQLMEKLHRQQDDLRQQIGARKQKIADLQDQHEKGLSIEQTELSGLQQELLQVQAQHKELLDTLSGQGDSIVKRLEEARVDLAEEQKRFEVARADLLKTIAVNRQRRQSPENAIRTLQLSIETLEEQRLAIEQQTKATVSESDGQLAELQQQQETLYQKLQDDKQKAERLKQQHETQLVEKQKALSELESALETGEERQQQQLTVLAEKQTEVEQQLEQATAQLDESQQQFRDRRSELAEATAEAQQRVEQTQRDIEELKTALAVMVQDDTMLTQETRKNIDVVAMMVAKLQKDIEPFAERPTGRSADAEERIAELLDKAERAFGNKNFTTPRSDNAIMWAEQALELDADDAQAKAVIGKVIDTYLDWVWLPQAASLQHYFSPAQKQRYEQLSRSRGGTRRSSVSETTPARSDSRNEPDREKNWFQRWIEGNGQQ